MLSFLTLFSLHMHVLNIMECNSKTKYYIGINKKLVEVYVAVAPLKEGERG